MSGCYRWPSALVLVVALVAGARAARADGEVTRHGQVIAVTPHRTTDVCAGDPVGCTAGRLRALSGLAFAQVTADFGYAWRGDGPAGMLAIDALSARYPMGTVRAGHLDVRYLPDGDLARVDVALADVDALFTCRAPGGGLRAPVLGQVKVVCVPGARLGVGGALGEVAWDPATARTAVRWASLALVGNLAGATSSTAYLQGHLDLSLGIDAETVWHGRDDARAGVDDVSRARLALRGLLRSPGARWELDGTAEGDPVLFGSVGAFHDIGVVLDGAILRNFFTDPGTVVATGITVAADYWSDPAMSIGAFSSPRHTSSLFVGAIVAVRRGDARD